MKTLTGYTKDTKKHLLLDSGAFFKNFIVGTDTYESARAAGKLLGATQGGGEFNATPEIRPIQVDGVKGRAEGLDELDEWNVYLRANLLEVTKESIMMSILCEDVEEVGDYYKLEPGDHIDTPTYIKNITWVGTLSGSDKPVIIQVYNTYSSSGFNITPADKSNGVVNMEFYGHYTTDGDNVTKPFAIFYPKGVEAISLAEEGE